MSPTRREFIGAVAAGVVGGATALNAQTRFRLRTRPHSAGGGGGAGVLSLSDITGNYLGAFEVPTVGGDDLGSGYGLTHRYVPSLGFRLYSTTYYKSSLVEFAPPADASLRSSPSYNPGIGVRNFGDIYQSKLVGLHNDGRGSGDNPPYVGVATGTADADYFGHIRVGNIFWDETDQRMYWMRTTGYDNDVFDSDLCFGYSTLNDGAVTGTGVGMWSLSPPAPTGVGNRFVYAMTPIPAAFAAAYCNGRRLGIGGGGQPSISTNGPVSMGPALLAIHPPNIGTDAHQSQISTGFTKLLLHPFHANAGSPYRLKKPPVLYVEDGTVIPPDEYTESDSLDNSMVWIDGPNKSGILHIGRFAGGNVVTTVAASPAPTATTFTAVDAGTASDLRVGDEILVGTANTVGLSSYPFARGLVTSRVGNDIAVTGLTYTGNQALVPSGVGDIVAGGIVYAGSKYVGGGPWSSRKVHGAFIHSPAALAAGAGVAGGTVPTDEVTWVEADEFQFPGIDYPLPGGGAGTSRAVISGATFDVVTKRLYVLVREQYTVSNFGHTICHVYHLPNV